MKLLFFLLVAAALRPPSAAGAAFAIVPRVSRVQLRAALDAGRDASRATAPLGDGETACVAAVAERGAGGLRFYVEKRYETAERAERDVAALRLASAMKGRGLLPGLDVVEVLSASSGDGKVRLSFTEGLDMGAVLHENAREPSRHAEIVKKYQDVLERTAAMLERAGWKMSRGGISLYFADPAGINLQFIPRNIVATAEGAFVLVDPY